MRILQSINKSILLAFVLLLGILFISPTAASDISITQINPGRLLTRQQVSLYLSVRDAAGVPVDGLGSQDFEILESEDGEVFTQLPVNDFSAHAADDGLTFFLLVDNSGSMYETIAGEQTDNPQDMRISHVQNALRLFLGSMDDSRDQVQLASFNTRFHLHSDMSSDPDSLLTAVNSIQQPEPGTGEGWTELFYSVITSLEYLEDIPGRKVVILLSDGENFPYAEGSGDPHPEFGDRVYTSDESVEALQRAGISLFSIRFGDELEDSLFELSGESGGRVFDTIDSEELADIYLQIRDQVLREYRLSYRAAMIPSERRVVKARYIGGAEPIEAQRTYFAGTLFGLPSQPHPAWLIISALAAVIGLAVLSRISFVNKNTSANLEIMDGNSSRTQVMPLTQNKTVIGSSTDDDVTLINAPNARPSQATVIFNPKDKSYTLESETPVKVNNQKTTNRKLESGDVINVGGSMVVFDDAMLDEGDLTIEVPQSEDGTEDDTSKA